jgi:hypothetical protein
MSSSNSKNHQIEVNSKECLVQSHQPKRHKVLLRDTQHESRKKSPSNSAKKVTRKGSENHHKGKRERQHKALRNHVESSMHTIKVHTMSSLPPDHPSHSLDITWSSQASPRKLEENGKRKWKNKWARVPRVGYHPSPQVFIWRHPKD